ncbi:MAG: hypothetical protein ACI3V0_05055 [Faecousia sp.]
MGKIQEMTAGWKKVRSDVEQSVQSNASLWSKIKKVIGILIMVVYRLRSVILAVPVVWYALKLAAYNGKHLPEQVGINLLSTGEFAMTISRELAVMGPLAVTAACLVLMMTSRKALYPWAVSIFTLILPVLLLVSNIYPN